MSKGRIINRNDDSPVINKIWETYNQYGFYGGEKEISKIEAEAFTAALKDLEPYDRRNIEAMKERLSGKEVAIKNLGDGGALELIAKTAIFCNANGINPKR